jgi:hypothetical protein
MVLGSGEAKEPDMGTKREKVIRFATLAAAVLALAGWAAAGSQVNVPSNLQGAEGNSDNLYPLNGDSMRYQQVIAASEFAANGAGWITQIVLRPDGPSGRAFSATLSSVAIHLSTTKRPYNNLSKTFSNNIGSDEIEVYSGALPLTSAFSGPDSGPKDADIVITLKAPFWYDPSAGNLLLDVWNYSGGKTTQLDAQDAPDTTSRVWSLDVNSRTATASDPFPSVGLVKRFIYS